MRLGGCLPACGDGMPLRFHPACCMFASTAAPRRRRRLERSACCAAACQAASRLQTGGVIVSSSQPILAPCEPSTCSCRKQLDVSTCAPSHAMASEASAKAAMLAAAAARQPPAAVSDPVPQVRAGRIRVVLGHPLCRCRTQNAASVLAGATTLGGALRCRRRRRLPWLYTFHGCDPTVSARRHGCHAAAPQSQCATPLTQDARQQEQKFAEARKAMIKVINWQVRVP